MAVRSRRLFGPVRPPAGVATLFYTAPDDTVPLLKSLRVTNVTDDAQLFDLCVGTHDADNALYWRGEVPARSVLSDFPWLAFVELELLVGFVDDGGLVFIGSGAVLV